jgi:hypothetical protein
MSGPWEQFKSGEQGPSGPWEQFSATSKDGRKPKPFKVGAEGLPDAVRAVAGDFNPMTQMAVGAKAAWDNAAMRLKQLAGGELTPEEDMTVKANRALHDESGMANLGGIGTEIVATAPLAGQAYGAIKSGAAKILPQWLAKTVGAGTIGGAIPLATRPVLEGESSAENAKEGAIGAIAADAAIRGTGRLVQPITQSEPVKRLLSQDIVPTIGQAGGKLANAVEERLGSVPFVGDVIRHGRRRAVEDMNRAAIQRAAPGVNDIGREGLEQAERSLSKGYQDVLSRVNVKADKSFVPHLEQFADSKTLMLSKAQRREIKNFLRSNVGDNIDNGQITGEVAKKIDSLLGSKAANLRASSNASEREMGAAFQDAQAAFRQQMRSGASPEDAAKLSELDKGWAQIVRLQRATATGKGGVFTPGQLSGAIKIEDKSVRKGGFAKGKAVMQDLSDDAVAVLGDKYPDSGTAGRLLLGGGALGAAGYGSALLGTPYAIPTAIGLGVGTPLVYSRPMTRYMLGDLLPAGIQPKTAEAIKAMAPYAAGGGALYRQE